MRLKILLNILFKNTVFLMIGKSPVRTAIMNNIVEVSIN